MIIINTRKCYTHFRNANSIYFFSFSTFCIPAIWTTFSRIIFTKFKIAVIFDIYGFNNSIGNDLKKIYLLTERRVWHQYKYANQLFYFNFCRIQCVSIPNIIISNTFNLYICIFLHNIVITWIISSWKNGKKKKFYYFFCDRPASG